MVRGRCSMMHWNYLALSLCLLVPHFQNVCSPLTFTLSPVTSIWKSSWLFSVFAVWWWRIWESYQAYGRFVSKEWDSRKPSYLYIDKHMSAECHITIVRFHRHCQSRLLHVPDRLYLTNWRKIDSNFAFWSIKYFWKFHSPFCLLIMLLCIFLGSLLIILAILMLSISTLRRLYKLFFLAFALLEDKQQFMYRGVW